MIDLQKRLPDLSPDQERIVGEMLMEAYQRGHANGVKHLAARVQAFYKNLGGKTVGGSVVYHIDQIVKEMKGEQQ